MLRPNAAPHEIWLQVASHLTISEIRTLALVHRAFAALALESWAAERSTFVLNTSNEYSGYLASNTHTDWGNTAHKLATRMQRYIDAGFASDVKHLVWSSERTTRSSKRRYFVRDLWRWLCTLVRGRLAAARLPVIYSQLSAIDTLTFLQDSFFSSRAPHCMRFMAPDAMWTTFAARLRELNICVNQLANIDLFLPSPRFQLDLPHLEVLRLACIWGRFPALDTSEVVRLARLAALFSSVSQTLRTLQVRANSYGDLDVDILEILIPEGVVCPKLQRLDVFIGNATIEQEHRTWRFIQAHAQTLRTLKFGRLHHILQLLSDNFPVALAQNWTDGGSPRIALSLELVRSTRLLDSATDSNAIRFLRSSILSLSFVHTRSGISWEQLDLASLHNLRHLSLDWTHLPEFGVDSFVPIAQHVPQIVSLSIRHRVCSNDYINFRTDDELATKFRQWHLQDLSVDYLAFCHIIFPSWSFLRLMKTLVPTIQSFNGQGHTEEHLVRRFDGRWPWEDNKYAGIESV